jgi:hypothetical protein
VIGRADFRNTFQVSRIFVYLIDVDQRNRDYASAKASEQVPTTAPFFFESETVGLMFVWHRWPQGFRW